MKTLFPFCFKPRRRPLSRRELRVQLSEERRRADEAHTLLCLALANRTPRQARALAAADTLLALPAPRGAQ